MLTVDLTWLFLTRLGDALFRSLAATPPPSMSAFPEGGPLGALTSTLVLLAGMLIWLGFKTEPLACVATLATFTDSFHRFPFWQGGRNADFLKFHFFQSLTPVGGLLLLALLGPGRLSIDAKKRE